MTVSITEANNTSSNILNTLELLKVTVRKTIQQRIAIVQPGRNKRINQLGRSRFCENGADGRNTPEVKHHAATYISNMCLHHQVVVKQNTQIAA